MTTPSNETSERIPIQDEDTVAAVGVTRPSKWIKGIEAETPVFDAAIITLDIRLRAAMDLFESARVNAKAEPDSLRVARVATRRAESSLRAFSRVLPKKPALRLRQTLKLMRRLAGEPRACQLDAHRLAGMLESAHREEHEAIGYSIGRCVESSGRMLASLADGFSLIDRDAYFVDVERCLQKSRGKNASALLSEFASVPIGRVEAGVAREISEAFGDLEQLHELRLRIKRLRYTYEIFRPCIERERFKAVYAAAKEVQSRLGEMNDLHECALRVGRYLSEQPPHEIRFSLERFVEFLEAHRDIAAASFITWWEDARNREPKILRSAFGVPTTGMDDWSTLDPLRFDGADDAIASDPHEQTHPNGSAL